ncbi:phasin family protein [uncultured Aquitalea sp.]|uniref:phasin family protein n=1 Tax=uncultured Aquitalea sp. TaxID=540272 RepID=UPI0025F47108|nr:phasin family protein [uncultured Aquitalea sp.]
MFTSTQEFTALGQAQFDKAVRLSSIVLAGAERFANLQLELTRKLLDNNAKSFKALADVKDPKAFAELQTSLTQPSLDQAFGVARDIYDAAVATQTELTSFVEEQLAEGNKQLLAGLDRLSKNAPAGSDVAVSALKTFVNTSNAAFESVSKTAKKVSAEIAEASVEAASSQAKASVAAVSRKKPAASTAASA